MQAKYFPPINEVHLKTLLKLIKSDSKLLDHADCPYSAELVEMLKTQLKGSESNKDGLNTPQDIDFENLDEDSLAIQINSLYKELQAYGMEINSSVESSAQDKNTYFRLSTSLLEKLIQMREKTLNMKQYASFQQEIINILDQVTNTDQRAEIITRLKKYLEA